MYALSYEEVDKQVISLCNDEKFEEAVTKLESVLDQFPNHLFELTWDIAVLSSFMRPRNNEKIMAILEFGNSKGLWYSLNPQDKRWEECKDLVRFQKLVTENANRKALAQEKAKKKSDVYLPKHYHQDQKYPLHICIHGWGEESAFFRKYWTSTGLENEYICLFVQSSQVATPIGYCWDDIEMARQEIIEAYQEVTSQYPIDMNHISLGGFSQGATMAMDIALCGSTPVEGFIALCPDRPEDFDKEHIQSMRMKKIKGLILTGENDGGLEEQKKMVHEFEKMNFPHDFIINPNLGHWFPENIDEQIDHGLNFIFFKV